MPGTRIVRRWLWAAFTCPLLAAAAAAADPAPPAPAPAAAADPTPPPAPPAEAPAAAPSDADAPPILDPAGAAEEYRAPLGFAGQSGILPRDPLVSPDAVPIEDRWRIGFPEWDRYGKGHPPVDDYPYVEGHWWDPFNQNVLKGDYPILGQNTFLEMNAESFLDLEAREVPTGATTFESTARPAQLDVFGRPAQFSYSQNFSFSFDLFHGDAGFKAPDWRVKVTPVFNLNDLSLNELGDVEPNVREGTSRGRSYFALQEWFIERKLADLSPDYDFVSVRVGSQPFTSDFRGFLFSDTNRAVRLFGTLESNRDQFNLIAFDQMEKDTNSGLNKIDHNRDQEIVIANFYRQDFIWPGYTVEGSVTYNHDGPRTQFNHNGFLVRPDPVGVFQPHQIDAVYFGWAGDGHINRFNITHQFYWVVGHDSLNPLANQPQDISAEFFAAELSYDRDWVRFRTSFFYSSGDGNANNSHATGFDTILDDPNFAGGEFSYWQRQADPALRRQPGQRQQLRPRPALQQDRGPEQFRQPRLVALQRRHGHGPDAEAEEHQQHQFPLVRQDQLAGNVPVPGAHPPLHRHRPQHRPGVPAAPEQQHHRHVRLVGADPGQGFSDIYNNFRTSTNTQFASFMQLTLAY